VKTACDLRFLLLDGLEAVCIALQHHLTGVLRAAMSELRLPDLARSFERHLRAENKSDRTVETYLEAVRLLEAFLAGRGVGLAEADRSQIEAFLADLLARRKPATAANRYRSLKVFYAWLEDEGEIAADSMAKMKPPAKSQVWIAGALTAAGLAALALAFLWQDKGTGHRCSLKLEPRPCSLCRCSSFSSALSDAKRDHRRGLRT
jgi:hypothetical protein